VADSNRIQIGYLEEVTWGTTPTAVFTDMRVTSDDLIYNVAYITSEEIRSDRNITDLIQTGADPSGGFNFELSFASPADVFWESALFSAWGADLGFSQSSDVAVTGATSTYASTGSNFTTTAADVGRWIFVAGYVGSLYNNGWKKIVSSTTSTLIVISPVTMADEGAGALTITMNGKRIRNGVAETSFSMQREASDIAEFFIFRGMIVNTMSLTAASNAVVTGNVSMVGKNAELAQVTWGSGASTAATTASVMNAVTNVGHVMEGVVYDSGLFFQEISFTISNNLRGLPAIGTLGNIDIGSGTCEVSGTANVYFKDDTLYDKYVGDTPTSLSFSVTDVIGNSYVFSFPKVKFESDSGAQATGQNSDLMENITWRAYYDSDSDCTMEISYYS
jgi:hypothetical protein